MLNFYFFMFYIFFLNNFNNVFIHVFRICNVCMWYLKFSKTVTFVAKMSDKVT